jgi:RecB family endonuclease NucS
MDSKTIDMSGLIKGFQSFWAERAERIAKDRQYKESDPHNVLTAYLQRVVNGGATVIEEYALGRGYVDIVVRYAGRNYVIELKIKDNQRSKAASQQQILGYMDRLVAKEGWLMIFDRKSKKSWTKKITWETVTVPTGQTIHVVGC